MSTYESTHQNRTGRIGSESTRRDVCPGCNERREIVVKLCEDCLADEREERGPSR